MTLKEFAKSRGYNISSTSNVPVELIQEYTNFIEQSNTIKNFPMENKSMSVVDALVVKSCGWRTVKEKELFEKACEIIQDTCEEIKSKHIPNLSIWTKTSPKAIGDYICRMLDGYIKMCHWDGMSWKDMWKDDLQGSVKEWIEIPYDKD